MALPPSPGSFTPWRMDCAPRILAPKGTTTGAFSFYRFGNERPATQYAAVQSAGVALVGIMSGTGALVADVTLGAMALGVVIPFTGGIVNTGIVQGGMLFEVTMGGAGNLAGTIELGTALLAPGQRNDVVWRCGSPLRVLRPTIDKSTGQMSHWRMDVAASTLQIGPPPEPPPETFWRAGIPMRVLAPK